MQPRLHTDDQVKEIAIRVTFMADNAEQLRILEEATRGMSGTQSARFFQDLAAQLSVYLETVVGFAANGDAIRRFLVADLEMKDLLEAEAKR